MGYIAYKLPTWWARLMHWLDLRVIPVFTQCPCSQYGVHSDIHRCKWPFGHSGKHESAMEVIKVIPFRTANGSANTSMHPDSLEVILKGRDWGVHRKTLTMAEHDYYFK